MSDNTSILDKYSSTPASPLVAHAKIPYRAADVVTDETIKRFRIHYDNGQIEVARYADLTHIISIAPERLGLLFPTGAVVMRGENIRQLLDDFQNEHVRAIYPFQEDTHIQPQDGDAVIRRMEWLTADQLQTATIEAQDEERMQAGFRLRTPTN